MESEGESSWLSVNPMEAALKAIVSGKLPPTSDSVSLSVSVPGLSVDPFQALSLYLHHFDFSRMMRMQVSVSPFAPTSTSTSTSIPVNMANTTTTSTVSLSPSTASSIYFSIRSAADHRSIDVQERNYEQKRWANYSRQSTCRPMKLEFVVLSVEEIEGEKTTQYGYDLLKMLKNKN
jgi:hypothetical protein